MCVPFCSGILSILCRMSITGHLLFDVNMRSRERSCTEIIQGSRIGYKHQLETSSAFHSQDTGLSTRWLKSINTSLLTQFKVGVGNEYDLGQGTDTDDFYSGHMRPLVHLCARLVRLRDGARITLLTTNAFFERARDELARNVESGDDDILTRIR